MRTAQPRPLRALAAGLAALTVAGVAVQTTAATADTTPPTIEVTLEPGQASAAQAVVVDVPRVIPKADVLFSFDLTGSMGAQLSSAKSNANSIMANLDTKIADARYGVISHGDYPKAYDSFGYSARYGCDITTCNAVDNPYRRDLSLTSNRSSVNAAINALTLAYGYDLPESYSRMLFETYSDPTLGWRPGARRIVIHIGDNVPHDNNLCEGTSVCTAASTGGDPGRDAVMGTADDLDLQTVLADMATHGVILFELFADNASGFTSVPNGVITESRALSLWQNWAARTGGQALAMASSADLPALVEQAVESSAATVQSLRLVPRGAYSTWATVTPGAYANVATPATRSFDVTFTVPAGTPDGDYVIPLDAIGDGANYGTTLATVHVVANKAPVVDAGGPYSVPEGGSVALTGSAVDPEGDALTGFSWSPAGQLDDAISATPTYSGLADDGAQTLTLSVTDARGNVGTADAQVSTVNVAPQLGTVTAGPAGARPGETVTVSVPFTDAGVADTHDLSVDWGDGSLTELALGVTSPASLSHTYAAEGTYAIVSTITDDDGGSATATTPYTVIPPNVGPEITGVTGPSAPSAVGTTTTVTTAFDDPDAGDTHTVTYSWGDGTTTSPAVASGARSVSGTHVYTTPGVYEVTVTVTDAAGESDTEVFQYVVAYDPSGGFVTGGGWISSPAGAYRLDPTSSGRANFGFVSKYKRGQVTPSGETQFQLAGEGFEFHSDAYEWLIVNGAKARYKGTGALNGVSGYGFMLTALDGQAQGGGGTDAFRMKIWDAEGTVVYDNQLGAAEDATPTTALGGGSIVVHK